MRAEERALSPPLASPPKVILLGPVDESEGEERRAQDDTIHDTSAQPEKNLGASNIGAEQTPDNSSEVSKQTTTQALEPQ